MLELIDIHTHTPREDIDSRMSYRPCEGLRATGLYSLGLHPCYADDMTDAAFGLLSRRIERERSRVWAIGEAGLDKLSVVPMPLQEHYFILQAELSERLGLPLVIHCVRAYNELIALKRRLKPRVQWIIHGYRRNANLARQLLGEGFALSFGKHWHSEALRLAYAHQALYIETDDDDISIESVREAIVQELQGL